MPKIKSFGAEVYVAGVAINGLTDINISGSEVSNIDTTAHDSSGGFREFVSGLKDGGNLELTGKYNYADAGQEDLRGGLGSTVSVYIILSDNSGFAFNAVLGAFNTSNPLDDSVEFTASARITGEVYPVYPTITVTGALTGDGSTPLTFSTLIFIGNFNDGHPVWSDDGTMSATDRRLYVDGGTGKWWLDKVSASKVWLSVSTSSLVPQGIVYEPPAAATNTGTPTLTGS